MKTYRNDGASAFLFKRCSGYKRLLTEAGDSIIAENGDYLSLYSYSNPTAWSSLTSDKSEHTIDPGALATVDDTQLNGAGINTLLTSNSFTLL
jgi:hypothetical protein